MPIHQNKLFLIARFCVVGLAITLCQYTASAVGASAADGPALKLADQGHALSVITVAANASAPEQYAAQQLADYLQQVTGADFRIVEPAAAGKSPVIAVGSGAAHALDPKLDLASKSLGQEGVVLLSRPPNLILSGAAGAARGTLFAVYTFLDETVGCRWWDVGQTRIPHRPTLEIPSLNVRYVPPFEYREVYTVDAFNADWSLHNRCNSNDAPVLESHGGHTSYAGPSFVHTSNLLVPSKTYFAARPEWFAEIGGKRIGPPAVTQWCLTNPQLLAQVKTKVRDILKDIPKNQDVIVSVSQNDNQSYCRGPNCTKVAKEEGSQAGLWIRFVNAIADDIRADYPHAAIDTLAYQYTRHPPKLTKPRPNVIVRLCDYECSFAQPLTDPANKGFLDDLRGWSRICQRLYVWDYITNFHDYLQPYPNWYVLGPNLRLFAKNGVKGVFEEGNYQSRGGEFAVLKQWLLARLMWNPHQDDRALIRQFLDEYYGAGAKPINAYMRLISDSAQTMHYHLGVSDYIPASYLSPEILAKSDALFDRAKAAVANDHALLGRVETAYASVLDAIIRGWALYRPMLAMSGRPWPFKHDHAHYVNEFIRICSQREITRLSEGGVEGDIATWARTLPGDVAEAPLPPELGDLPRNRWLSLPARYFSLHGVDTGEVELVADPSAPDHQAARMPGNHVSWSTQMPLFDPSMPANGDKIGWTIYAVIRVETQGAKTGMAFQTGVYDDAAEHGDVVPGRMVPLSQIPDDKYHVYKVGTVTDPHAPQYVWIAPVGNGQNVKSIWVDRIILVRNVTEK